MFPAIDGAQLRLFCQAIGTQRAGATSRSAGDIADLPFARGISFAAVHRFELFPRRTTIDIGVGAIAEITTAESTLGGQPSVAIHRRHIGGNRICLARPQGLAVVVSGISQHCQCLGPKCCLGCHRHCMQLATVIAVIDHMAGNDQLVLVVDGDLSIVSGHRLTALRQ